LKISDILECQRILFQLKLLRSAVGYRSAHTPVMWSSGMGVTRSPVENPRFSHSLVADYPVAQGVKMVGELRPCIHSKILRFKNRIEEETDMPLRIIGLSSVKFAFSSRPNNLNEARSEKTHQYDCHIQIHLQKEKSE
jgi:hypothetical protein